MNTMYHVTREHDLGSILRDGLIPQVGERSVSLGEHEPRVYLFATLDAVMDAQWLYEGFDEDEPLVVL